jgi:1-acyl-sn-glycerol-3-phosphate acyltransferase
MLKAKHNMLIYPFFKWYAIWIINRHFQKVTVVGSLPKNDLPILLISNHISWWDGFFAMYINLKLLKRKFHFMMLETQLRKFWFFNYTGGFSVSKKSKSIIETLNYTSELLCDSNNMVLIFPQGEIQTMHTHIFKFERGIDRVLNKVPNRVQVVFMANLVDYFSYRKPCLYMYIEGFTFDDSRAEMIEEKYNEFYNQCIEKQKLIKSE